MTKLYIVKGDRGAYDSHVDWLVCAYSDESLAQQHVDAANVAWKAWAALPPEERRRRCAGQGSEVEWLHPLDPVEGFSVDGATYYTIDARDYSMEVVELRDVVPASDPVPKPDEEDDGMIDLEDVP